MSSSDKTFSTTVSMFRELRLDPQHWANREAIRFFRRRVYDQTEQTISYYPKTLDALTFSCPRGHIFTPDWLAKRPPILPFYDERDGVPGWLRMQTAETPCLICKQSVSVPLPTRTFVSEVSFFGDEAIREIPSIGANKFLISYSVVNQPRKPEDHKAFAERYFTLKQRVLANTAEPLHFQELWNEQARANTSYANVTDDDKRRLVQDLAVLLRQFADKIVIYNATSVFHKPTPYKRKEEEFHKAQVYSPLLLRVVEEMTGQGLAPRFFMERTGTDGWAINLFSGGRLTLMWPFISHGLPVGSPEFVVPTTSIYLELADFVTFIVGRYVWTRGQRCEGFSKKVDLDPKILGKVAYQGYGSDGTCFAEYSEGYPWDRFFRGTAWEGAG
jgi:hypothetical protein